jgi:hypothetical protein
VEGPIPFEIPHEPMSVLPSDNIAAQAPSLLTEFERKCNPARIPWLDIWQHYGQLVGTAFLESPFFTGHSSYYALYEHPAIPNRREFAELSSRQLRQLVEENTNEHSCGIELDVTISPKSMDEFLICNHDGQMLYLGQETLDGISHETRHQ